MRIQMIAAGCLLASGMAAAAPMASFDSDNQGWSVVDFLTQHAYLAPTALGGAQYQAGNGGYVDFVDPSNGSFFFAASSAFLGDLGSYFGGTLSYQQKLTTPSGFGSWTGDADVVLISGGQIYTYQHANRPGSDWTSFAVSLDGNGWRKGTPFGAAVSGSEFQGALGNVSALYLNGEHVAGVVETTALDNVALHAVPEPETYAMLLAGLGVMAVAVRRRKLDQ